MIIFEGGLQMTLLTYAPIRNLPAGVRLESAEDYLPWKTFQKLLNLKDKGVRQLQVLADFVLGLWVYVNGGGWRFDGDCIVVRKLPTLEVHDPPHYGHFVGSMERHPCTQMPRSRLFALLEMEYLKNPQDKLYIATPAAFCAKSPLLLQYLKLLASTVMDSKVNLATVEWAKKEQSSVPYYNIAMQALKKVFLDHGCDGAIADAGVCSPLPYYLNEKTIDSSKNHVCKVERLKDATCVNCFFSSTKKTSTGAACVLLGSMDVVEKGCTWDILLDSLGTPLGDGKWKEVVKPTKVQRPVSREMGAVCFQELLKKWQFALPASRAVQEVPHGSEAWRAWCSPGANPVVCRLLASTPSYLSTPLGPCSSSGHQDVRGSPANLNHHLPYYNLCLCRTHKISHST